MAWTIAKAQMQDALDITNGRIMVNGVERGFVTGLTVDGKSPEDLINCISGVLRRRKPETYDRSVDSAVLYNNLKDLAALKGGVLFNIVVELENPDKSNADNIGQILTLQGCRIQDHAISITDSSTFKMSGRAKSRDVTQK